MRSICGAASDSENKKPAAARTDSRQEFHCFFAKRRVELGDYFGRLAQVFLGIAHDRNGELISRARGNQVPPDLRASRFRRSVVSLRTQPFVSPTPGASKRSAKSNGALSGNAANTAAFKTAMP